MPTAIMVNKVTLTLPGPELKSDMRSHVEAAVKQINEKIHPSQLLVGPDSTIDTFYMDTGADGELVIDVSVDGSRQIKDTSTFLDRIHEALYWDSEASCWDPNKEHDSDVLAQVAEIIQEYYGDPQDLN